MILNMKEYVDAYRDLQQNPDPAHAKEWHELVEGTNLAEVSFRDLLEHCLEDSMMVRAAFDPRINTPAHIIREAISAVDSTGFSNISGQLIVNSIMQGWQSEAFIASQLIRTIPTRLDGEKIPGIAPISDPNNDNLDNLTVREGMPYPHFGVTEDYIEVPPGLKRGLKVGLTKEAIFFDRTGRLVEECRKVGEVLGLNKEKRVLDAVAGYSSGNDRYKWKGTYYATYLGSVDSGAWVNHLDGVELQDYSDIESAELLFQNMLDPNTGEPIVLGVTGMTLLVPPYKELTGRRLITATELRETTNTNTTTVSGNPLGGKGVRLAVSRLFYRRLRNAGISEDAANKTWIYGDLNKAFAYMEHWPVQVAQRGMESEAAWNQDITMEFKASERGTVAVMEPRAAIRCTGASTSSSSGT